VEGILENIGIKASDESAVAWSTSNSHLAEIINIAFFEPGFSHSYSNNIITKHGKFIYLSNDLVE